MKQIIRLNYMMGNEEKQNVEDVSCKFEKAKVSDE